MIQKLELVVLVLAGLTLTVLSLPTGPHEDNSESLFSNELLDTISAGYVLKAQRAQHLRKELVEQLNLLGHFNTISDHTKNDDKLMLYALLGHVRQLYTELDEILDSFVPSVPDAEEIVEKLRIVSQPEFELKHNDAEDSNELKWTMAKRRAPGEGNIKRNSKFKQPIHVRTGK